MLVLAHFFSFLSILQTQNKTEKTSVTPALSLREKNMGALHCTTQHNLGIQNSEFMMK